MRFFSFVKEGFCFTPVEIQVSLLPGLPEVKFTGLVDMAIKESATRLKSAFRKTGFKWPLKQQLIINLSPAYIKKSSPGMDMALAGAILWKTGQIQFSSYQTSALYFYGEVDLNGKIITPKDWSSLPLDESKSLLIGALREKNYKENIYSAGDLRELVSGRLAPVEDWKSQLKAPEIPDISFSSGAANLLKITAVGEHPLLLCGSAGSGKTTMAESLYYLLSPPERKDFEELKRISGRAWKWRSFVNPHHTTSPLSMIGGGSPLFIGEISKAHGGQLLLDEYLEFHPKVQEALREPLEKGEIYLSRKGHSEVFPSRFLLTATSNLCPCGDYEPGRAVQCAYSLRRCQSYLDRLSGPMMDRFDLLAFSKDWRGEKKIRLKELFAEIEGARLFRLQKRRQKEPNSRLNLQQLEAMAGEDISCFLPDNLSLRRKRALLRSARSLSDIKKEKRISLASLNQALSLSVKNFFFLKNRLLSH